MATSAGAPLTIGFDLARLDSPLYRANLHRVEDEVEKLAAWIESVLRALKALVDELNRENECSNQLAAKVNLPPSACELVDAEMGSSTLRSFSDALQCTFSFKAKLMDDINEYLILPLQQFNKEDVREMREQRRLYERALDRYEGVLLKFTALSKVKEASSLRELYEVRKAYIRTSMDYSLKALSFKSAADRIILDQFTGAMDGILEFYSNAAEVYKGFKPRIDKIKSSLPERKSCAEVEMDMLSSRRKLVEDEAVEACRPSYALPLSNVGKQPGSEASYYSTSRIEKEGYLFKRSQPKSPLIAPAWIRRWCFIKNGQFGFQSLARQRGSTVTASLISVLLCEVRVDDKQDRRYCIELISSKKAYLLQAETEMEMKSWLAVFEAAKLHSMQQVKDKSMLEPQEAEAKDRSPAISAAGTIVYDDEEWAEVLPVAIIKQQTAPPPAVSKLRIIYDDKSNCDKLDRTMHTAIAAIPESEQLIDSFTGALVKEAIVRGVFYLTENSFIFYPDSTILSLVAQVLLPWTSVYSIYRKDDLIHLSTVDGPLIIRTLYKEDLMSYGVLNALFWNARTESPLFNQDLFDYIYKKFRSPSVTSEFTKVEAEMILNTSGAGGKRSLLVPKWPDGVTAPATTVNCACADHHEKLEPALVLNTTAKHVFDTMFGGSGEFFCSLHEKRGDWDVQVEPWNGQSRNIHWILEVNNPMTKIKETDCVETQTILTRQEHVLYIVDTVSRTVNMPYGDTFQTCARFCISYNSKNSCKIVCSTGVKFLKSTMMKSFIKPAAAKGMADYIKDLVKQLHENFGKIAGDDAVLKTTDNPTQPIFDPMVVSTPYDSKAVRVVGSSTMMSLLRLLLVLSLLANMYFFRYLPSSDTSLVHGMYLHDIREKFIRPGYTNTPVTDFMFAKVSAKTFLTALRDKNEFAHTDDMILSQEITSKLHRLRMGVIRQFEGLNQLEESTLHQAYVQWMQGQIKWCDRLVFQEESTRPSKSTATLNAACKKLKLDLLQFLRTVKERKIA